MEKRSSALEFKTSGKYLRALKQILETMQTTRRVLENKELDSQKCDQSGSPTVKKTISPKRREPINQAARPTKMATETKMMEGITMLTIWLKSSQSNPKCSLSVLSEVNTRDPKINCINTMQNNEQRYLRQDIDTVSLKLVTKIEVEVARNDQPKD
ncbi:hypothetical protein Tco_1010670 [Tanacetum coccineum]